MIDASVSQVWDFIVIVLSAASAFSINLVVVFMSAPQL